MAHCQHFGVLLLLTVFAQVCWLVGWFVGEGGLQGLFMQFWLAFLELTTETKLASKPQSPTWPCLPKYWDQK